MRTKRWIPARAAIVTLGLVSTTCGTAVAASGWTTTQLTDNSTDEGDPAISGTNVVWLSRDGSEYRVSSNFGWQSDSSYGDWEPATSGMNVVWTQSDGPYTDHGKFLRGIDSVILRRSRRIWPPDETFLPFVGEILHGAALRSG